MKYKIGDTAWYAQRKYQEKWIICPHCFGSRALTVILGDDSTVSIDCDCCRYGFEGSKGYIKHGEHLEDVREVIIERIELNQNELTYGHSQSYSCKESELFDTKEEAINRANELAEEYKQEELRRVQNKDKLDRNWAWHVKYHREAIKRAEKELDYHTKKLNVAKYKAKEVQV